MRIHCGTPRTAPSRYRRTAHSAQKALTMTVAPLHADTEIHPYIRVATPQDCGQMPQVPQQLLPYPIESAYRVRLVGWWHLYMGV